MTTIELSTYKYPIMEHFYTVQGEGKNTGRAAYFIRLAGCDVGCVWCDVKASWNAEDHPEMTVNEIISNIEKYPAQLIVITGGEPTLYNLEALTTTLKERHYEIAIETSGTNVISGHFDHICLSPKKFKAVLPENLAIADELKVIAYNNSDFEWALTFEKSVKPKCKLFIQPEYSKFDQIKIQLVDFVKENPQWNISLQTHKFLNIP